MFDSQCTSPTAPRVERKHHLRLRSCNHSLVKRSLGRVQGRRNEPSVIKDKMKANESRAEMVDLSAEGEREKVTVWDEEMGYCAKFLKILFTKGRVGTDDGDITEQLTSI